MREGLRQLMQGEGYGTYKGRMAIRAISFEYGCSMRRERQEYYLRRTRAAENPETELSFITDGASSE